MGLLLVDKPVGVTSHDVVDHIRKAAGLRRVGHTGTLDPNATGLLILCLGPATRLSEHLTGLDKTYEGVMRLGVVTESYDLDGAVVEEHPVPALDKAKLQEACDRYVGDIQQVPPMVSAVKVGGERLYRKARKGEVIEREPRAVTVHEFTVLNYEAPDARVRVRCTSGTYVRSLCHDVGQDLGCGGALATLRRTMVGKFSVEDAAPMDSFTGEAAIQERLISMDTALDLPEVRVGREGEAMVGTGGTLGMGELSTKCPVRRGWVQVKSEAGELLALGTVEPTAMGVLVHPKRVFLK